VFRPATYKSENEYELVLMKNRREELIDIPLEYVESIEFNMGTHLQEPTKLTLTIPSHINRVGELMEYPLYNMIKGKMQLKLSCSMETGRATALISTLGQNIISPHGACSPVFRTHLYLNTCSTERSITGRIPRLAESIPQLNWPESIRIPHFERGPMAANPPPRM
jgi:hypothetical protein